MGKTPYQEVQMLVTEQKRMVRVRSKRKLQINTTQLFSRDEMKGEKKKEKKNRRVGQKERDVKFRETDQRKDKKGKRKNEEKGTRRIFVDMRKWGESEKEEGK